MLGWNTTRTEVRYIELFVWDKAMRALITCVCVLLSGPSLADSVRHLSVPEVFWGRWAPGADGCKDDKTVVVVTAKGYTGPRGTCAVQWVTETAGVGGSIYSTHMRCTKPASNEETTEENEIMLSRDGETLAAGAHFNELKVFKRCPAN
jgi:hypothetical protein